jgi:hypothetical protein
MTTQICRGALLLLSLLALPAAQAFDASELPAGAQWYVHADLAEMRSSEVGKHLHDWLEDNVFDDIRDETGIDLARKANALTAFSDGEQNVAVVLAATLSDDDRDTLLALAGTSGDLDITKFGDAQYYRISELSSPSGNLEIDSDELFFSLAERDRLVVASERGLLEAILSGTQAMPKATGGALLVLNADRSLMQGGLDTQARDGRQSGPWDSNILRNARQLAFALSDQRGLAALEIRLIADDARMAESLGSIVRGLIGLYALSDEANEDVSAMLASTKIDVDGNALAIRSEVQPDIAIRLLND